MDIYINDAKAEVALDDEKTLGDIMAGIEAWISPTGNRIQKIMTNGKEVPADLLSSAFDTQILDIERLDIYISAWIELASEALDALLASCLELEKASFEERTQILNDWKESAGARFLNSDIPDIYHLAGHVFSGDGLSVKDFSLVIEERLRELMDPWKETSDSEALVELVSTRLEEFPLDMQTGKDQRAAETIQLFSQIVAKLLRIFSIHKSEGRLLETFVIDDRPALTFIEEFNGVLNELSQAYESKDTVLTGDIAEYELAPRFLKLFTAIKSITKSQ